MCSSALHNGANGTRKLALDTELARSYHEAMRALQKELSGPARSPSERFCRRPGVMRVAGRNHQGRGGLAARSNERSARALAELIKMREREGKHLAKDLIHRLKVMRKKSKGNPRAPSGSGQEIPRGLARTNRKGRPPIASSMTNACSRRSPSSPIAPMFPRN